MGSILLIRLGYLLYNFRGTMFNYDAFDEVKRISYIATNMYLGNPYVYYECIDLGAPLYRGWGSILREGLTSVLGAFEA